MPPRATITKVTSLLAGTFAIIYTASTLAEEPLLEEMFQSTLVHPQEAGEVQFTMAPQYHRSSETQRWELPVAIEYGVTDTLQIELEWDSYQYYDTEGGEDEQGIGDFEIGLQNSWMHINGSAFHSALGVEVSIPTGDEDKELGEGETAVETYGILATDLSGERGHLFIHAGIEFGDDENEEFANIGWFTSFGELAVSAEWNWSQEERFLTPGLVRRVDDWTLGVGVPIGLNDTEDDYRVIFMLTYEPEF